MSPVRRLLGKYQARFDFLHYICRNMNEQIVANHGESLYPKYRGEKIMPTGPKESGKGRDEDVDSSRKTPKPKDSETSKKKRVEEERQARLQQLRKEAKEANESSKRTREAAESVAGRRQASAAREETDNVQQKEEPVAVENLVVGKTKGGIMISGITDPLQIEPENIQKIIGQAGYKVELKTPAGFAAKTFREKLDWYKEHGVIVAPAIAGGGPGEPFYTETNAPPRNPAAR